MSTPVGPLVSVVTPVYNGEAYLAECIESVLAQSYPDWEYVIVNNCSTDRSLEIAERYARRDTRIRIHTNERFLPALANLNHAFRQISPDSRHCKAVHADDWLFPECLERMVAVAEKHPSVGLVSAYRLDEERVGLDGMPYPSPFSRGRDICRRYFLENFNPFGSPTSLLVRADIVRARPQFYDEAISHHADTEACFDILREHDFGFVHQVLTFTRRHNESRSAAIHRFETRRLAKLFVLLKHGPTFLTPAEYRQVLRQWRAAHYRFLAQSAFDLREREFWDYQTRELARLGLPLSRLRLLTTMLVEMADFRTFARRVRRGLARRHSGTAARSEPAAQARKAAISRPADHGS